jgi:NAD-reducing hydrogenase small subunit
VDRQPEVGPPAPLRPRVATVWLGGCSGCHMSLLDMDERLLEIASRIDLVYSPLMDVKTFPDAVDITLVEGAIANEEHLRDIARIRKATTTLVAFGDCAVSGNVTALRNPFGGAASVLQAVYADAATGRPAPAFQSGIVPALLDRVLTVRECVPVDLYLPGCPPSADLIHFVLTELAAGRTVRLPANVRLG